MKKIISIVVVSLIVLGVLWILPLDGLEWGSINLGVDRTISVTGTAQREEKNQLASFSAGVEAVNANKETAVSEVNQKMEEIITMLKDSGIAEADIQTQSMSVYQDQESYYENGAQRYRPGQWRVSNTVEVTVREVDAVSQINDMLTKSGATNVYGPNYRTDDSQTGDDLLSLAVADAQQKAQALAKSQNLKLGKIQQITEMGASNVYPIMYDRAMGGGGGPAEAGTSTLSKTVSVTFEIR